MTGLPAVYAFIRCYLSTLNDQLGTIFRHLHSSTNLHAYPVQHFVVHLKLREVNPSI